jgi:hypothetical protein
MNYLREFGPSLIANGYRITPIRRGTKAPIGVKGWTTIDATLQDVGNWASAGFEGVGMLCRDTPGVDIDVLDAEVSKIMVDFVKEKFPGGLIRVGKAPKTLLVYRTNTPFKKIRSATYEDRFGDINAVEILGDGQQFVAFAEHPDTFKPYRWDGPDVSQVERADLPLLTEADARAIVSHFETIASGKVKTEGWQCTKEATNTSPDSDNAKPVGLQSIDNLRPPLNITSAQIKHDLESVNPNDYDRWLQVGMALHHQFSGGVMGLNLWDEWSSVAESYSGRDALESRWSGLKPDPGQRPLTFATVRRWANESRMAEDPMNEFLARYVYIAHGNTVHDLAGTPHEVPFELNEFINFNSEIRMKIDVPKPTVEQPDRTVEKTVPVSSQWMISPDRKKANAFVYDPGQERMLKTGNGRRLVNRFHMPAFPDPCEGSKACEDDLLGVFFRHMEFIIPEEIEREWFISWMAYNLQFPGMRCNVTPLLIATDHGTGRGWIVQVMNLLLGSWNCSKTKMSTLNGDSSAGQFQDFMNETLLCAVEEVKDADKPYGVLDSIRSYLTENTLEINIKYGAKETKRVFTNFIWNSNHADALVLKAEDRRINVFKTKDRPKGAEYYERLYGWLEPPKRPDDDPESNLLIGRTLPNTDGCVPTNRGMEGADDSVEERFYDENGLNVGPGVACLWHFLMRRDLTGFSDKRPIENESRRELIRNSQTDVEEMFLDMVASPPMDLMTREEICQYLDGEKDGFSTDRFGLNSGLNDSERRQIKKLCQHHLTAQPQVKVTFQVSEDGETRTRRESPWKVRALGFTRNLVYKVEEIREIYEKR